MMRCGVDGALSVGVAVGRVGFAGIAPISLSAA